MIKLLLYWVIMDFDRSIIIEDMQKQVYLDIRRIFLLVSSELDVKTNIQDKVDILNKYVSDNEPITKDVYSKLCNEIDSITITFVLSELKLPW